MSQRTLNSTGNKGRFLIVDNDGKPLTSVVFNAAGLSLGVILQNGTRAAITLSIAGDLLNCGDGVYQVAVPDSAYTSLGDLTLCGVITDGAVVGFPQQVIAEVAAASSFTKLFRWLGVLAGAGSDPATLAEIQATDGGATFDNATDSLEALGDAVADEADAILAVLQGSSVIQVASPNVRGNLVLTQGDTYDGLTGSNPKAQWTVTTDYTDGWAVTLTIRDKDDAVVYTRAGSVDSATTISVPINVPNVSPLEGCPGVWQGKYDVQLTKSSSVKTIAIGVVYVNEDQTR
jgi:hypothetical protein